MKRPILIALLLTMGFTYSLAQEKNMPVLKGPYLGQKAPGTSPEVFAPGFVSTPVHEFSCSFTPDGTEFYFSRRDPVIGVAVIMVTKLREGAWTKPEVVPFVEMQYSFEPMVTPDGKRLYFSSGKPIPGQSGPPMNILYVDREGDKWGAANNPGPPFNPAQAMQISEAKSGTIYTTDISGGPGTERIAAIRKVDGKYTKLEKLGPPINGEVQRMYPFVAPDESYLIFCSRVAGQVFRTELLVSFRQPDGSWGNPRPIDLGMDAGTPYVSPDGKYLFFTAGERGKSDIYWVSAKVFEDLRPSSHGLKN